MTLRRQERNERGCEHPLHSFGQLGSEVYPSIVARFEYFLPLVDGCYPMLNPAFWPPAICDDLQCQNLQWFRQLFCTMLENSRWQLIRTCGTINTEMSHRLFRLQQLEVSKKTSGLDVSDRLLEAWYIHLTVQ